MKLCVSGTTRSGLALMKEITYLHERCQVGHLMMVVQAGFMPTASTRKSLKHFAEKV
jgi:hypothetical protein